MGETIGSTINVHLAKLEPYIVNIGLELAKLTAIREYLDGRFRLEKNPETKAVYREVIRMLEGPITYYSDIQIQLPQEIQNVTVNIISDMVNEITEAVMKAYEKISKYYGSSCNDDKFSFSFWCKFKNSREWS